MGGCANLRRVLTYAALMRRSHATGVVLFFCATTVFAAHPKLPSKKQAETMLQQASEAVNLWAPGTPPYHLSADIQLKLGGKKFNGTYDLWWAAPDKYREGLLMPAEGGTIAETDLALGDKFYVLRNTPTLSIPLWELRKALRSVPGIVYGPKNSEISRVYWDKRAQEVCVDKGLYAFVYESFVYESCFDKVSGSLQTFRREAASPWGGPAQTDKDMQGFEAADFTDFPVGKRFPREINTQLFDMKLQVTIRGLNADSRFDRDTFQPPPHSKVWDWCPNPVRGAEPTESLNIPIAEVKPPGRYIGYYINVAPNGRVNEVIPVRSDGKRVDHRMEQWLRENRYAILSCHGHAISWEGIVYAPEASTLRPPFP